MRTRLKFSKTGALAFIGHLDFLRVFGQTIRRAALPAAFSQGFNPHLLLSFALPLPLGMESLNDYADLTLEKEVPSAEIIQKLNAVAPRGLIIKDAYPVEDKAASVVCVADYGFKTLGARPLDPLHLEVERVLAEKEIVIAKKTKKGIKDTDIRADIFSIEADGDVLKMRLSAGSARFLHPLTVAGLLYEETPSAAAVTRLELYRSGEGGGLVTL